MTKAGVKSGIILIFVTLLCTCIDPYTPAVRGYQSLLVVEGLITDANSSFAIKLSRTISEQNSNPEPVSGATVSISDDLGSSIPLTGVAGGIYKTDSLEFHATPGRTYILHLITPEGMEYESDSCLMRPVNDIDSIYFAKESELINNSTETAEGIKIYLNSSTGQDNGFVRWDFDETWKFKIPLPKKFDYINDTTIVPVDMVKEFCWKSRKSDKILVHSPETSNETKIEKFPVYFIATGSSDRLLIQYNILVKQYSISKKEYEFWNNMVQVNSGGGDIFAAQPYPVISNIHNVNMPGEKVLGYFQVSAMKQKRKTITISDIAKLNLPLYHYPCKRIEISPSSFPISSSWQKAPSWDDIYEMYCITSSKYDFVEPIFLPESTKLSKLIFSTKECANCELTGTSIKPDFWTDSK